jgi:hypothetical protein
MGPALAQQQQYGYGPPPPGPYQAPPPIVDAYAPSNLGYAPPGYAPSNVGYAPGAPPPPVPMGYPPPPAYYPQQPMVGVGDRSNSLAVASFVCGILGLVPFWVGFILCVAAIVMGAFGIQQANRLPDQRGKGLAIAGLVLGIVFIVPAGCGL